jgi:hypothetical protein
MRRDGKRFWIGLFHYTVYKAYSPRNGGLRMVIKLSWPTMTPSPGETEENVIEIYVLPE